MFQCINKMFVEFNRDIAIYEMGEAIKTYVENSQRDNKRRY